MARLTKEELIEATAEGVRRAFVEMMTDDGNFSLLTAKDVFEAIRDGTSAGIWRIATNATHMPCADFYDSIKEGVTQAMKERDA